MTLYRDTAFQQYMGSLQLSQCFAMSAQNTGHLNPQSPYRLTVSSQNTENGEARYCRCKNNISVTSQQLYFALFTLCSWTACILPWLWQLCSSWCRETDIFAFLVLSPGHFQAFALAFLKKDKHRTSILPHQKDYLLKKKNCFYSESNIYHKLKLGWKFQVSCC